MDSIVHGVAKSRTRLSNSLSILIYSRAIYSNAKGIRELSHIFFTIISEEVYCYHEHYIE